MGKEENLKVSLFQSIIRYVRENHAEAIDKAYEYFWDGSQPDEFMGGIALELGFINFEDWLVFDYKVNEDNKTFIDIYIKDFGGLKGEELALLQKIKSSVLSLYEVESVSKDRRVLLKDLLLGGEYSLKEKTLTKGLNKGEIFAARLLNVDGSHTMSVCVYPYSAAQKKKVLDRINIEFSRFVRNVNSDGSMRDYLKNYGDIFNLIWMDFIINPTGHEA
jgi:hypothetical protein